MQVFTRRFLMIGAMSVLAGCASKFRRYKGPEVTRVVVFKKARRMHLLRGRQILKSYRIDLGFAPKGDKNMAGDGRTPEGKYFINRRNPESDFHLSLGINYPNARDRAEARALGVDPGGDIFIHGRGNPTQLLIADWTWGCIAVTNKEMEEVYAMVRTGTPIHIHA
jgi:murein L,D-transpeptidase YafK